MFSDNRIHYAGDDQLAVYTDTDTGDEFICEAKPSAALTDAVWRVRRAKADGSRVEWAGGTTAYKYAATDLATVMALFE